MKRMLIVMSLGLLLTAGGCRSFGWFNRGAVCAPACGSPIEGPIYEGSTFDSGTYLSPSTTTVLPGPTTVETLPAAP